MSNQPVNGTALITGASRGIGRAMAIEFGKAYRAVIINYREDSAGALETQRLVEEAGGRPILKQADISNAEEATRLVDETERELGPVVAVVNNAGVVLRKHCLDITADDWLRVMSTNVNGMFFVSQAAARHMVKRGSGSIVNTGSIATEVTVENRAAYATSKGAVHLMTKAMALDLAPMGVRVNAVAPGPVQTDMMVAIVEKMGLQDEWRKHMPMGRLAYPQDIAKAALFLCSDEASYISGSVITVDGALSARANYPLGV